MDGVMGVVVQYTLAAAASVIALLLSIVIGVVAWIFKKALQDTDRSIQATTAELQALRESDEKLAGLHREAEAKLSAQISQLRAELPEKYVTKADSYAFRKEMLESIERMGEKIDKGFEVLRDKLEEKLDKK